MNPILAAVQRAMIETALLAKLREIADDPTQSAEMRESARRVLDANAKRKATP